MDREVIALALLIVFYLIQIIMVGDQVRECNYTCRLNVIIDLIPFIFALFLARSIILGVYEFVIDTDIIKEFKDLKWTNLKKNNKDV